MRRIRPLTPLFFIPATALLLMAVGCTGGDKKGNNPPANPPADGGGKKPEAKGAKEALEAKSTDGVFTGVVKLEGKQPDPAMIKGMLEHADKKHCLAGTKGEQVEQTWLVGKDNGVANAIVFLQPPDGKTFKITDELKAEFKKPAVLDQPHCAFVPHVVAMYPGAGQQLLSKNSAAVTHNTNVAGSLKNPAQNVTLAPGQEQPLKIAHQGTPISVTCNVHPWMNAKIVTFDHPYFSRTDENGAFEIKNVPTGVELTVMIWHEATDKVEAQKMTFQPGANKQDLTLKTK